MSLYPLPVDEADLDPEERIDVMTYRQFDEECQQFLQSPPSDYFEFRYYKDTDIFRCARPQHGLEIYEVFAKSTGKFCGVYNTGKILRYLKMKTWILVDGSEKSLKLPLSHCEDAYE